MRVILFVCALVLVSPAESAHGAPPDERELAALIHRVETRYGAARTLRVAFLERYLENGRVVRVEAGNAYFLKPGKMRWNYEAPEKNVFLVDGKYAWFYSPADRTATRMLAKDSEDWRTPIAFLTSHMKMSRLCARLEPDNTNQRQASDDEVFRCVLREETQSQSATSPPAVFELSRAGELKRIVVPEEGGRELEFSFTGWQWNPALDKSLFEFVPPRGVAIVEGLLPDSPAGPQ